MGSYDRKLTKETDIIIGIKTTAPLIFMLNASESTVPQKASKILFYSHSFNYSKTVAGQLIGVTLF